MAKTEEKPVIYFTELEQKKLENTQEFTRREIEYANKQDS